MADVARLAGVSAMTVSRALRQDSAISAATRARVLEVVDEIGYVPDKAAGSLSSGRSGLVAAIFPTLSSSLFALAAKGLSETIAQSGLELQLASSEYKSEREEELLRSMLRRRPEAVAVAGVGHTDKAARMLHSAGIPVIEFLDGVEPPIDHRVGVDFAAVSQAVVTYLTERGRTKLALIVPRDEPELRVEARLGGMREVCRRRGLQEPILFRQGGWTAPAEHGSRGAAAALASGSTFDGMIFTSDEAAIGGVRRLEDAGLRVPSDVAVVGFGDCEVAGYARPSITTVSFNSARAGVEVGKIVLSELDGERRGAARAPYRLNLEFQLLERESA